LEENVLFQIAIHALQLQAQLLHVWLDHARRQQTAYARSCREVYGADEVGER